MRVHPRLPRAASFLAALLFAAFATGILVPAAQAAPPAPFTDDQFQYRQIYLPAEPNGRLNYRLFVPPTYNAANKYPVVMFFHGDGERQGDPIAGDTHTNNTAQVDGDLGQFNFAKPENQAIFPCFLILVQRTYNWNDDRRDTAYGILAELSAEYNLDLDRVTVTGVSGGGGPIRAIANTYTANIAAFVSVCGVGGSISNLTNKPTWFFHATDDGPVPPSSSTNAVRDLRNAGGQPIYTFYASGGHFIWGTAYETPTLIPWLALQRRNLPPQGNPVVMQRLVPSQNYAFTAGGSQMSVIGTSITNSSSLDFIYYHTGTSASSNPTTPPGSNLAQGNASLWNTPSISLGASDTTIHVIGAGTTWSTRGGYTFYSTTTKITRALNGDTTPPTVQIDSPNLGNAYTTPVTSLNMTGVAADATGVTSVIWKNNRGGAGAVTGTTNWWANNISLKTGLNVITMEARDSANNMTSDTINVTCTEGPPPPSQWTHVDTGTPQTAGNMTANPDGSVTIRGAGTGGMFGSSQCHFAYINAFGDCTIVARLTAQSGGGGFAKAGVLIQQHTGGNSFFAATMVERSRGAASTSNVGWGSANFTNTGYAPTWLKLVRVGNSYTSFYSANGTDWTQIGSAMTVNMTANVLVGLFTYGDHATSLGEATFDNVTVDGAPMPVTGYAAWAAQNGVTGSNVDPLGDPNKNGRNSLIEYASRAMPEGGQTSKTGFININGEDYLTLEFDRPADADDLTYTVEASSDPGFASVTTVGTSAAAGNTGTGFVSSTTLGSNTRLKFRDTVPMSNGPRFMRFTVNLQ